MMKIDEFTAKKIQKMQESNWKDAMSNPKAEVRDVALGAYCGVQRTLLVLGIDLGENKSN